MTLIMLIRNKGNNTNLEKSMEACYEILDAIVTQLVEIFMTGKIKSFNIEECLNMSNQKNIDIHKEQCFKETPEEEF